MDTLDWLARLVAFDTTSRNSNLALIEAVEAWFTEHKTAAGRSYDSTKQKANLFATVPAKDGSMQDGLILSGHTDVVPIDGQAWDGNPFTLRKTKDRVFGRGTSDMKGFIAVALALLPQIKQLNLKRPVHFALSYDEEVGCRGAPFMIAEFSKQGIKPSACIVGEPTNMQIIIGHKGIQVFCCRFHGVAAHSSLTPQGCNAIDYAAELVCYVRHLAEDIKVKGPFDQDYDVPFTTISTNQIKGGTANNIIPELCEVYFEFRNLPKVKPETIVSQIKTYLSDTLQPMIQRDKPEAKIEFDALGSAPSFESSKGSEIYQLASSICGDTDKAKVAYATEAGLFEGAHIPTIICGPGSIEQAHRPNEFVTLEQLQRCEDVLLKIINGYCA